MRTKLLTLIFSSIPMGLYAQVDTLVDGGVSMDGVVSSSQPDYAHKQAGSLDVVINTGCYGVNLRNSAGTVNLSSGTPINIDLELQSGSDNYNLRAVIPANAFGGGSSAGALEQATNLRNLYQWYVDMGWTFFQSYVDKYDAQIAALEAAATASHNFTVDVFKGGALESSESGALSKNVAAFTAPIGMDSVVVDASGDIQITEASAAVKEFTISQGNGGNIRMNKSNYKLSKDGKTLTVTVKVPSAQIGVCGSYVSPLMVFFNEKRPTFKNTVAFQLGQPLDRNVHWPDADSPGYFLAFDLDRDGAISSGEELFGSYVQPNGFKALGMHDENKDSVIDSRDRIFSKLLLWQDKNGDGISQKDELLNIKEKGLVSISLEVDASHVVTYSGHAQSREKSTFVWKDESGKLHEGAVEDIWFNTKEAPVRNLAQQ